MLRDRGTLSARVPDLPPGAYEVPRERFAGEAARGGPSVTRSLLCGFLAVLARSTGGLLSNLCPSHDLPAHVGRQLGQVPVGGLGCLLYCVLRPLGRIVAGLDAEVCADDGPEDAEQRAKPRRHLPGVLEPVLEDQHHQNENDRGQDESERYGVERVGRRLVILRSTCSSTRCARRLSRRARPFSWCTRRFLSGAGSSVRAGVPRWGTGV